MQEPGKQRRIHPGNDIVIENKTLTVDSENMRNVMRNWATGVVVVSSCYEGEQHGMTVSSFTSISLEPPLVLASLREDTRTHALVRRSGVFGVTILDQTQQEVSDRFAGRTTEDEDRYIGLETFTMQTGSPLLVQALGWLDCRVQFAYKAGDHTLFIGRVIALREGNGEPPLIYFNRSYWRARLKKSG
jgi:flavin reductase (DIM6/NTAB) family NADH-FMN oxidoreductase RutF